MDILSIILTPTAIFIQIYNTNSLLVFPFTLSPVNIQSNVSLSPWNMGMHNPVAVVQLSKGNRGTIGIYTLHVSITI